MSPLAIDRQASERDTSRMPRVFVATIINSIRRVEQAKMALLLAEQPELQRADVAKALGDLESDLQELGVHQPFLFSLSKLREHALTPGAAGQLPVMLDQAMIGLTNELTAWVFYGVRPEHKNLFLFSTEWFGKRSSRWTATVFHSMRVLEHGLRQLAADLGVQPDADNWGVLIDQMEKRIKARKDDPRTPEKARDVHYFSKAAANFQFFKDAWRNHVSHSKAHYSEREARHVLDSVKRFMAHLAKGKPPVA